MTAPEEFDAFEIQREERLRTAMREAEQGCTEYLVRELSDPRPMPHGLSLWLADLLDPNGASEFAARLTRRRHRGRPKATKSPAAADKMAKFVALLLPQLRALDAPLDPSVRLLIARWFDPNAVTAVKATIRRRRAGAPERAARRIALAAYHIVVNIRPDSNLKGLLSAAIEEHSAGAPKKISRSRLVAYLKAHWRDLFPKAASARAAHHSGRRKKIE